MFSGVCWAGSCRRFVTSRVLVSGVVAGFTFVPGFVFGGKAKAR